MKAKSCAAFAALLVAAFTRIAPAQVQPEARQIQVQTYPTYAGTIPHLLGITGMPQVFVVAVLPTSGLLPGGMAVDKAGNIYMSHHGALPGEGGVLMLPKDGREPVCIMEEFLYPSDIEISPDGRSLLLAGPGGRVSRRYFGLSVRVAFCKTPREAVVFLKSDTGTYVSFMSEDGYFHFPELLVPEQKSFLVDIVVQSEEESFVAYDRPLQAAEGQLHGQTVIDVGCRK